MFSKRPSKNSLDRILCQIVHGPTTKETLVTPAPSPITRKKSPIVSPEPCFENPHAENTRDTRLEPQYHKTQNTPQSSRPSRNNTRQKKSPNRKGGYVLKAWRVRGSDPVNRETLDRQWKAPILRPNSRSEHASLQLHFSASANTCFCRPVPSRIQALTR